MAKLFRIKSRSALFLVPLATAVIVRVLFYIAWLQSPVSYYSSINGLDMKTLMEKGLNFYNEGSTFSAYKLLTATAIALNGGVMCPELVVAFQLLLGVATVIITSYITLALTGKRLWAMLAGCTLALYAPLILYEGLTLKESLFVFLATLSLAAALRFRKRILTHPLCGVGVGMLFILPVLVRFSAVLWLVLLFVWLTLYLWTTTTSVGNKKTALLATIKTITMPIIGVVIVLTLISTYNYVKTGETHLLGINWNYALSVGTKYRAKNLNEVAHVAVSQSNENTPSSPLSKKWKNLATTYLDKFLSVFNAFEYSNNVNYYFMRQQLFPLHLMLGATLLMPFAVTGLILMTLKQRFRRKESILFFYLIGFVVSLTIFVPLGRYRVVLAPLFCITAIYPFYYIISLLKSPCRDNKRYKFIGTILLFLGIVYFTTPNFFRTAILNGTTPSPPLRAADFIAYGHAIREQKGEVPAVGQCYKIAYTIDKTSLSAMFNLSDILMKHNKFSEASTIIRQIYCKNPTNYKLMLYYTSSLLGKGEFAQAENILLDFAKSSNQKMGFQYHFNLAESRRLQGHINKAIPSYELAIQATDIQKKKNFAKQILQNLRQATKPATH